jgi:hypothetical protein
VAAVPWEYLRDPDGRLLAARLNLVRAIPVAPVDDRRPLNTEGEWQRVVEAVSQLGKALTVTCVRPPTLSQLERTLSREHTTIVHFMGHSDSRDGKGYLSFEEDHARSRRVAAADFAATLVATNIFLVVLSSCRSAVAGDWTALGNIARGLVRTGIPDALGRPFVLPDDTALALSQALYDFLLQGRGIAEAVRRSRRALEGNTKLRNDAERTREQQHAAWVAGIPVLYTSRREQPAAPLRLAAGRPTIQPNPERLQQTYDLTALPAAAQFVGREQEIGAALDALLAGSPADFVVLHGLGGIGKTALARAIAGRVSWHYEDQGLAVSFETFASLDAQDQRAVNEQFADRSYNRLARFYGLDPADAQQYPTTAALQQAILQRRKHTHALLILDNIETLIDTQRGAAAHTAAKALAAFISRLRESDDPILMTSRIEPPADWGTCKVVPVGGLAADAGADFFRSLLPADRWHLAPEAARQALSRRVRGHPLAIRLLAGRFSKTTTNFADPATALKTFLDDIEAALQEAEQATPSSLEDPERQASLYACLAYSIRRLTPAQRDVLHAASLFQAPFPSEFATQVMADAQTPTHLQSLLRLGLLEGSIRTFKEGELILLDLHPVVRWYIRHHLTEVDAALRERYGAVYLAFAEQAYDDYDRDARLRYLVRQSLPDCEAALQCLAPASRSALAYYLATPYQRLGQNHHAQDLLQQALEIDRALGDVRSVAVTQHALAAVLAQLGQPQVVDELMQAILDFVTAADWEATRQVVEAQQALLFRPEVGAIFAQNIAQARAAGNQDTVRLLELHLALLRECQASGIAAAFARLTAAQAPEVALPFDAELIPRSIAAPLGGPQERMAHMQYLAALAHETTDADAQALISTIQLALFNPADLAQFGRDLTGICKQVWEFIVASVEAGDTNPEVFELIANNTVAVLGSAMNQRSAWRSTLIEFRNQATAHGDRDMVALVDAVTGLLDADGAPHRVSGMARRRAYRPSTVRRPFRAAITNAGPYDLLLFNQDPL